LSIEGIELPSPPFAAEGAPAVGSTIAPGHSITITVTFKPTELGTFGDEIGLATSGGDKAVGLSGNAAPPGVLQISSEANDFGEVPIGTVATKTFTVANTGGTAVTLTKSKPPDGGAFAALTSLAEGTTIQPGASVTETVSFAPTQAGQASGVWLINGNDAHPRVHEVQFTGVGVVPAAPTEVTSVAPPSTPPSLLTPIGAISPVKVGGPPLRLAALRGKVSSGGRHAHKVLLAYTLSTAAEVKLTIYRRVLAHGCRRATGACVRWESTKLKRTVTGRAGSNKLTIDLGALPLGEYRLDAQPFPPSGVAGATQYLRFKLN
jgi:iron transport multicopper oxidase